VLFPDFQNVGPDREKISGEFRGHLIRYRGAFDSVFAGRITPRLCRIFKDTNFYRVVAALGVENDRRILFLVRLFRLYYTI